MKGHPVSADNWDGRDVARGSWVQKKTGTIQHYLTPDVGKQNQEEKLRILCQWYRQNAWEFKDPDPAASKCSRCEQLLRVWLCRGNHNWAMCGGAARSSGVTLWECTCCGTRKREKAHRVKAASLLGVAVEKGQAAVREYDDVQIGCDDPDNRRHQEAKLAPLLAEALRDVLAHVGRRRKA